MVNFRSKISPFLLLFILFSGCAVHQNYITQPSTILFKTQKFKYYDAGFIKTNDFHTIVNIYNSGQTVLNLEIATKQICINSECYKNSDFNNFILSNAYPEDTLFNIFNGKDIFYGEGIEFEKDRQKQAIKNQFVDILYEVNQDKIFFVDYLNSIKIVIRRIK